MQVNYVLVLYKIENTKKARFLYESKIFIGVWKNRKYSKKLGKFF
jgi:hypothetical protein